MSFDPPFSHYHHRSYHLVAYAGGMKYHLNFQVPPRNLRSRIIQVAVNDQEKIDGEGDFPLIGLLVAIGFRILLNYLPNFLAGISVLIGLRAHLSPLDLRNNKFPMLIL
jgi:hypothetical protein